MTKTTHKMTVNCAGIVHEARMTGRGPQYLMSTFPGMNLTTAEQLLEGKLSMSRDGQVSDTSKEGKGIPPLKVVEQSSGQLRDALERAYSSMGRPMVEIQYEALNFVRKWARFSTDDKYEAMLVLLGKDAKMKENGTESLLTEDEMELLNALATR